MADLLPCPFCGGRAEEVFAASTTAHLIKCTVCGARSATHLASHGGSASEDWNRRAPDHESLWGFWNDKARELAEENAKMRKELAETAAGLCEAAAAEWRKTADKSNELDSVLAPIWEAEARARAITAERLAADIRRTLDPVKGAGNV